MTMKTETNSEKDKPSFPKPKPESKLKAAYGKYRDSIVEKEDCWDTDLKKTIRD